MLEMRDWKTMKVNNQPLLPSTMLSPHLPPLHHTVEKYGRVMACFRILQLIVFLGYL